MLPTTPLSSHSTFKGYTPVQSLFYSVSYDRYVRAMNSQSLYTISTPYEDAFGPGKVITLSKAILSER